MNAPFSSGLEGWTPARVDQLRRHHRLGLTAAESAVLIGGVSKNAVISKRNRLGLTGLAAKPSRDAGPTAIKTSRQPRIRFEPVFRCEPLPPMDPTPPPGARPRPLALHRAGECLWPLGPVEAPGDWKTLFCCAPKAASGPYCLAHAARARAPSFKPG